MYQALPVLRLLIVILSIFSIGSVYFNALASMGAAALGLALQFVCAIAYLAFIHVVLAYTEGGLTWAWGGEIFYWVVMMIVTIWYLKSERWHKMRV